MRFMCVDLESNPDVEKRMTARMVRFVREDVTSKMFNGKEGLDLKELLIENTERFGWGMSQNSFWFLPGDLVRVVTDSDLFDGGSVAKGRLDAEFRSSWRNHNLHVGGRVIFARNIVEVSIICPCSIEVENAWFNTNARIVRVENAEGYHG